jgi:hypothetical protein
MPPSSLLLHFTISHPPEFAVLHHFFVQDVRRGQLPAIYGRKQLRILRRW